MTDPIPALSRSKSVPFSTLLFGDGAVRYTTEYFTWTTANRAVHNAVDDEYVIADARAVFSLARLAFSDIVLSSFMNVPVRIPSDTAAGNFTLYSLALTLAYGFPASPATAFLNGASYLAPFFATHICILDARVASDDSIRISIPRFEDTIMRVFLFVKHVTTHTLDLTSTADNQVQTLDVMEGVVRFTLDVNCDQEWRIVHDTNVVLRVHATVTAASDARPLSFRTNANGIAASPRTAHDDMREFISIPQAHLTAPDQLHFETLLAQFDTLPAWAAYDVHTTLAVRLCTAQDILRQQTLELAYDTRRNDAGPDTDPRMPLKDMAIAVVALIPRKASHHAVETHEPLTEVDLALLNIAAFAETPARRARHAIGIVTASTATVASLRAVFADDRALFAAIAHALDDPVKLQSDPVARLARRVMQQLDAQWGDDRLTALLTPVTPAAAPLTLPLVAAWRAAVLSSPNLTNTRAMFQVLHAEPQKGQARVDALALLRDTIPDALVENLHVATVQTKVKTLQGRTLAFGDEYRLLGTGPSALLLLQMLCDAVSIQGATCTFETVLEYILGLHVGDRMPIDLPLELAEAYRAVPLVVFPVQTAATVFGGVSAWSPERNNALSVSVAQAVTAYDFVVLDPRALDHWVATLHEHLNGGTGDPEDGGFNWLTQRGRGSFLPHTETSKVVEGSRTLTMHTTDKNNQSVFAARLYRLQVHLV